MTNEYMRHFIHDLPTRGRMIALTLFALLVAVGIGLRHQYAAAMAGESGAIIAVVCVAVLLLVVACGWVQRMRRNSHA